MIPDVMYAVTARKFRFKNTMLKGYARFTVKGDSYPGIIPSTNSITEGIIYFNVDELSLERLDEFEGDLYQRIPIQVETKDNEVLNAETYIIKPRYRRCLSSKEWNLKEFAQKHLAAFLETYSGFKKNS